MMFAPASARPSVIARPIPRVPPVTSAVCPWSENMEAKGDGGAEASEPAMINRVVVCLLE